MCWRTDHFILFYVKWGLGYGLGAFLDGKCREGRTAPGYPGKISSKIWDEGSPKIGFHKFGCQQVALN
jgi:hypothetical protein